MSLDRPAKLQWLVMLMLAGFLPALISGIWNGAHGLGYPHNTFLFSPGDRFHDYAAPLAAAWKLAPYDHPDGTIVYPPFAYALLWLWSLLPVEGGRWLFLALTLAYVVWTMQGGRGLSRQERVLATLVVGLSYPVLFALDRGNWELLVYAGVFAGLDASEKGRERLAGLLLGAMAAMKIVPAVFGLMLVARRQWRGVSTMLLAAVGLTLLGSFVLDGTLTDHIEAWRTNQRLFNAIYAFGDNNMYFAHSYFTLMKFAAVLTQPFRSGAELFAFAQATSGPYTVFALGWMTCAAVYVTAIEREPWKQVMVLAAATCLLPLMSGDYKLLHLMVALTLFVHRAQPSSRDGLYVALWALLLIPRPYGRPDFTHLGLRPELCIGGLLTPVLLTAFLGLFVVEAPDKRARLRAYLSGGWRIRPEG